MTNMDVDSPRVVAENVGIVAMDIYFPSTYVSQAELEKHDNVSAGKYTIGLGQTNMAFCSDREDIATIMMNAVSQLMTKYNVSYEQVGRLEVGTETLIDKSKSVKTTLMQLFKANNNFDVEGVTSVNGCYGGTAALFNSVAWVESSSWDGRYALVVCGDIAVYSEGNARPTGGCGVVAMLVGPNAPIVLESGLRATHSEETYDFFKPKMSSEYPVVDGHLSVSCYFKALDNCFERYAKRFENKTGEKFTPESFDYMAFHSPYGKLVQKASGRVMFDDFKRRPSAEAYKGKELEQFLTMNEEDSYTDRPLEMAFRDVSKEFFKSKVTPTLRCTQNLGNIYTGAVYGNLLSLISEKKEQLTGSRVMMFSYGSGFIGSLFSLRIREDVSYIAEKAMLFERLDARKEVAPATFAQILKLREHIYGNCAIEPAGNMEDVPKGAFYLSHIDDSYRRYYAAK